MSFLVKKIISFIIYILAVMYVSPAVGESCTSPMTGEPAEYDFPMYILTIQNPDDFPDPSCYDGIEGTYEKKLVIGLYIIRNNFIFKLEARII